MASVLIYLQSFDGLSQNREIDGLLKALNDSGQAHFTMVAATPKGMSLPKIDNFKPLLLQQKVSYGQSLKLGFYYAIQNKFDAVIVFPVFEGVSAVDLALMVAPILEDQSELVLAAPEGSRSLFDRFIEWRKATPQESLLRTFFVHTKATLRAYSVKTLSLLPFDYNSDDYAFDTDIAIQFALSQKRISRLGLTFSNRIPSFRQDLRFFITTFRSCLLSKTQSMGFWYHPKFDFDSKNSQYTPKFGFNSSHEFAKMRVSQGSVVADLGCGPGFMAQELRNNRVSVISVDRHITQAAREASDSVVEANLDDFDFRFPKPKVDCVLALDVLEHLRFPEAFLKRMREVLSTQSPVIIATTGNVAFFILRLSLLFGTFNYGKRGVLDLDHTRLFTFASFRALLEEQGYEIVEERGIPIPFPLVFGPGRLSRCLLTLNELFICLSKGLFSYQIGVVARIRPTLSHLLTESS